MRHRTRQPERYRRSPREMSVADGCVGKGATFHLSLPRLTENSDG